MGYWPSLFGQDGWILARVKSQSINNQKITSPHPAILTEQAWSIKDLLWLSGKFLLWDTASTPELHLACSHSQSQHRIWFLLPTHRASHIITGVTDYSHDQLRGLAEVLVCISDLASETKTMEWNLLSTKKKT